MNNKKLIALICSVLLLVGAAGATLAWLTAQTQVVKNTFTVGDINITLTEDGASDTDGDGKVDLNNSFEIIPGTNLEKEPVVTVLKDSEACWLFVEVTEKNWPQVKEADGTTLKVKYEIAEGWKPVTNAVTDTDGNKTYVYYREVAETTTADTPFVVLKADANGKEITVSDTLTKEEMNAMTVPQLTFKAYAVQKENITTVTEAWAEAK